MRKGTVFFFLTDYHIPLTRYNGIRTTAFNNSANEIVRFYPRNVL